MVDWNKPVYIKVAGFEEQLRILTTEAYPPFSVVALSERGHVMKFKPDGYGYFYWTDGCSWTDGCKQAYNKPVVVRQVGRFYGQGVLGSWTPCIGTYEDDVLVSVELGTL
jgi:hypothetical protein